MDRPGIGRAGVGPGIVGQDPLDPDAVVGEPDGGVKQDLRGRRCAFVEDMGT